jgi:hypothetical protein
LRKILAGADGGRPPDEYILAGEKYELATHQSDGSFPCRAITGFVMPVRAAFDDDVNREARRKLLLPA